ncbi:MAG: NAD(P)-dependent alcohol dehydrogenase [Bacteroidales bacterium]|nr:NAD(P)-dependent alcohol dehydrogenase [Bacteroidales bacterium]MCF8390207.1 NAD(P)-dependent alcohol dehydrogenase [Bacteroidales bacterium]
MRSIIINKYGGPEVLEYVEMPKPVAGRGELVIKTKFAAVNPADWKVRQGNLKIITGRKFPKTLGIEASGIIDSVGEGVSSFVPGQHVFAAKDYTTGTYSEYFKISEKNVLLLPESMPFEDAASIAVTGVTAYQCLLRHGGIEEGMNVLVNGASGGLGIMSVQIAKILGATVSGVCSSKNVEFVKSLGADTIIDYTKENILDSESRFDIIIDSAGNLNLKNAKKLLSKRGIIIKVNISMQTIRELVFTSKFSSKKIKLVLMRVIKEDFQWVRDQIAMGNLKVYIDTVFDLKDCKKAHEYSETLRAKGKILLKA